MPREANTFFDSYTASSVFGAGFLARYMTGVMIKGAGLGRAEASSDALPGYCRNV